jgi:hypothetical protein
VFLLVLPARLNGIVPHAALTPETGKDDPPLEVLVLRNNSIGDEGATALAQVLTCNKTLKKIDLYWNNIGNTGLVALVDVLRPNLPKDYVLVPRFSDCMGPCACLFSEPCNAELMSRLVMNRTSDTMATTAMTPISSGRCAATRGCFCNQSPR